MLHSLIKKPLVQGIAVALSLLGLGWIFELSRIRSHSASQTHWAKPAFRHPILAISRQLHPSRWGQVVAVPSGDSIVVLSDKKRLQLRLCGIDAPDRSQPLGDAAQAKLQALLDRQPKLRFVPIRQQSDHLIAEALIPALSDRSSEQLLSQSLVESGLAYVYQPFVTECPYQQAIDAAEAVAQKQQQGVWAIKETLYPWEARRQHILEQLAQHPNPLQVFRQIKPTYLSDGMQQTMLGLASWYGPKLHGRLTANGETYDQNALTAAHHSLPFNTHLKVTNLENGKSVIVRINDYHPAITDASIDLSQAAAARIGAIQSGVVPVAMEVLQSR